MPWYPELKSWLSPFVNFFWFHINTKSPWTLQFNFPQWESLLPCLAPYNNNEMKNKRSLLIQRRKKKFKVNCCLWSSIPSIPFDDPPQHTLVFTDYTEWLERGFANSCGLLYVSAGHCTSKWEEGSFWRLQLLHFTSLSTLVVTNLLSSQRLLLSVSTIFASALKGLKQYNAAGSPIKGEENWNALVVWRNYCVWHSYDCGKACDKNWFEHESDPFLNTRELQAVSTEGTQGMQMHLGRLVLWLLLHTPSALTNLSHLCVSPHCDLPARYSRAMWPISCQQWEEWEERLRQYQPPGCKDFLQMIKWSYSTPPRSGTEQAHTHCLANVQVWEQEERALSVHSNAHLNQTSQSSCKLLPTDLQGKDCTTGMSTLRSTLQTTLPAEI